MSLQLAFRFDAGELSEAVAERAGRGVAVDGPTDQPWGPRAAFFRDPDGNVLELVADL